MHLASIVTLIAPGV